MLLHDAPRQPTHHLEALGVDVVEHELVDRKPGGVSQKTFHQLRRVGAAPADNRDFERHGAAWYCRIGGNC